MAKVGVQRAVQRERRGIGVEGTIRGGRVVDGLPRETGNELVGETDALTRTQRVAWAGAVVLSE